MKKFFKAVTVALSSIVLALCFSACANTDKRQSEFISVNFSPYPYTGQTKKSYYSGENFSEADTCVGLKCYLKDENTEYTYNFLLSDPPSHISYEVSGFDSSAPVESQTITVKFTSSKIDGEIIGTFNIQILPPLLTELTLKDEAMIKSTYVVGEQLKYEDFTLHATYGNGTEADVPVTAEMVSGFDTTTASVYKKSFIISYEGKSITLYYNVAPAEGYEVFDGVISTGLKINYINCFVPTTDLGYEKTTTSNNTVTWMKPSVAGIEMGYTTQRNITEAIAKNFLNALGYSNAQVKKFENTKANDALWATVCEFTRTGSTNEYKAVFFDKNVKVTQGLTSVTQKLTVMVVFTNYGGDDQLKYAEANEVIENVINSIRN